MSTHEIDSDRIAAAAGELFSAVSYMLRRVGTDPDFRHHMLMTETLERACRAYALAVGRDDWQELRREVSEDKQPEYRKLRPQLVEVREERDRLLKAVGYAQYQLRLCGEEAEAANVERIAEEGPTPEDFWL